MLVEKTLLKTAYHFLLLLVGFDTLTYRKEYYRSPTLVGHQPPSWSTAPDLLNRRPRRPQCRPFTNSLVPPFTGPSYKPSSAATDPPHRKHCITRPPKPLSTAPDPLHGRHIQLHQPCFTDVAASSGYFDLYSFGFLFIMQLFTYHR